jgi:hypothetical protein
MQLGEQGPKNSSATTFVLLAVATFVALAPLCSAAAALPEGPAAIAGPASHALRTGQHEAPMNGLIVSASRDDHSDDRCAEYSCCAAAELANSAASRQKDDTGAPVVAATTTAISRCPTALACLISATSSHDTSLRLVPLRL